nr:hypothetical protein [Tanacetum cinerariifolium]
MLKNEVQARDNVLVTLKQKLNQAEKERDDLKLKFDKFQTSSKSLTELLASQTNDKHGLGYFSLESDSKSLSPSCSSDRVQPSGGYNVVPPPITGNFMPPKPNLVFHTVPIAVKTDHSAFTVQLSLAKPVEDLPHTTRPMAPIIEDWVSDSEDESEPNDPQSVPSFVQTSEHVKTPRHSFQPVEAPILAVTPKPTSPKTNSSVPVVVLTKSKPVSVTAVRQGNPQYALKDKGVIDSGFSWYMTGNMSYLSDFQELNGGYVAFREKAREEANQQYMLFPVWSTGSSNPQNKEGDAAFDRKEHDAEKSESAVNLSSSSSALLGEQDNMTKKKDKGKSPIEYFTGNRDLNADFEDYSKDSSNDVSAAGPIVPTAGQNYSNSTNPFSDAGPSNTNISPTHGKASLKDDSQPPDMLEIEDIAYSDHENVDVEADFNNLETSITVSPIPTTRTHKAHPISQIIGDLSSTTQTKSMTRVINNQGGLLQIFNDDFHTSMFACILLQEEPKRVKQKKDGIFISQDKYVVEILKKFGLTEGKSASTLIDTKKPLLKDPDGEDVDVHIYRLMIGSLMYLTSSRPDILFAVCACACFQVTPKASHLHAMKRIFRYLKGKPHLGLWYPKDSPFDLVVYSYIDYASASLDRKSTTRGCQFLGCRLISWQCEKQTVVATSSTEAEFVAGASCCT